ncbi:hypothetical protein HG536_0G03620 [Torulaspora globosa]|uniref:2-hydroxyacyl-CoA lyase n=1 Tax=Torulaspora globosa TaxID=48254 RepID=A0A7G3ZLW4_9SACH|nr:uncharacterized protein HG536_0G03620 [Torulaspora globosa]QLL34500.1 hypothetical protein HG536_0G03620 [Torulaspora globosa]
MEIRITDYFTELLKDYGIDTVFGIVGIPIVELANTMIAQGIRFIACRNEQSASYAASAYGYLTGKPGILLVVGGPGLIHALAGIYNSMSNKWPLLVIAGSTEDPYKGGFQELDQISLLRGHLKFTGKLSKDQQSIQLITYEAMRFAVGGIPGATYIDFPGRLIEESIDVTGSRNVRSLPKIKYAPDPKAVSKVADLLSDSKNKRVLLVIGKGAVEHSVQLRKFVDDFNVPFLPTPMAKGVVPDSHPLNVSSARSKALKEAEVVLILGARLNWILHYGQAPKWNPNAIFVQVDNDPTSLGQNNSMGLSYALCGDLELTLRQLTFPLSRIGWKHNGLSKELQDSIRANQEKLLLKETSATSAMLNYNQVYHTLRPLIDDSQTIIVSEGANTMDIARISFPTDYPKHRLDAGTNATMGIGLGYAIAAKLSDPEKNVILIQGDSAYGFSAMELETAARNQLALVVIVMNNSGIYHGTQQDSLSKAPSTALSKECRYELVGKGLGTNGFLVRTLPELKAAFQKALNASRTDKRSSVINVIIEPGEPRKIAFGWQTGKRQSL